MKRRYMSAVLSLGLAAFVCSDSQRAYGVNPNALEDAYWRFEEGTAGQPVLAGGDGAFNDTVLDSLNDNHMEAFNEPNAPLYISDNFPPDIGASLPPTPLRDGVPNTLAWKVVGTPGGGQDVYSSSNTDSETMINNGIIGGKYDHDNDNTIDDDGNPFTQEIPNPNKTPTIPSPVTGFTLEAAFNVADLAFLHGIIAREGRPGLEQNLDVPESEIASKPTLALKVRPQIEGAPDPDEGKLEIELFDQSGALKSVKSAAPVAVDQWYYAAVVNDGATLSLYLNHNDGQGYQLEGSTTVNGALFQGLDPDDSDWDRNWTIGRLVYGGVDNNGNPHTGGVPSHWFTGLLDEIRLSNEALDPSQFLFTQNGDLDANGKFDGRDFLAWQRGFGTIFDAQDLADWRANFGSGSVPAGQGVPEPAGLGLAGAAAGLGLLARRRRSA